jgi:hypothetical protein
MKETYKMTIKGALHLRSERADKWTVIYKMFIILFLSTLLIGTGCTASHYRKSADKAADKLIKEKQTQLFGKASGLNIERPSDTLRRRLMIGQNLPYAGKASLGSDNLDKIKHWPEKNYPGEGSAAGDGITVESGRPSRFPLYRPFR